jgi:hypothetical protein
MAASTNVADRAAVRAQRLAWTVLLLAFGVWAALVVGTIIGVRAYFSGATDSPPATLRVVQGLVHVQATPEDDQVRARLEMPLGEGSVVESSQNSEALLYLHDGSVARLRARASLQLTTHRIGQYNPAHTGIALALRQGPVVLATSGQLAPDRLRLDIPQGSLFPTRGEFLVWPEGERTRVVAYAGSALVVVGAENRELQAGQRIELSGTTIAGPFPAAENLVANGDFSQGTNGWETIDVDEQGKLKDVRGERRLEHFFFGDQPATSLRITRRSQHQTHNETGLRQVINRDVRGYQRLLVRARVKLNDANLSGGGSMGSEYPMIIRVQYEDARGGQPDWFHGFYFQNEESRLTTNGEQIPRGEWFQYEGDLTTLEPPPAFIKSIEVFASGHDFDAEITAVELLAE